ncbi:MAG TPA: hypothetical protein VE011_05215 [Candidatus Dormibacteraeota bacterium]|nr:hypothetical protein [Candidatus Dormibacteraeota bacterium]
MIVRIELWPGGDPRPLRQIAILGIVNVGLGGDGQHEYEARYEGRITRLSHDRADGALVLVARAIDALAEGSDPDPKAGLSDEADFGLDGCGAGTERPRASRRPWPGSATS